MNILRKQKKGAEDSNKANNSIILQQPRYFLSGNFLFLFRKKWAGGKAIFRLEIAIVLLLSTYVATSHQLSPKRNQSRHFKRANITGRRATKAGRLLILLFDSQK